MPVGRGWWHQAAASGSVVWLTAAGSLTATALAVDQPFALAVAAQSSAGAVAYAALGTWPGWLTLGAASGALTGTVGGDPALAPVWTTTAGRLGGFNEGAAVALTLAASGSSALRYGLLDAGGGPLPWGLVLDAASGAITGTVADLVPGPVEPGALPWVSPPAGALAPVAEGDVVSLSLSCTGASVWSVVAGALPWGLVLDAGSGVLAGTVADMGGGADVLTGPVFSAVPNGRSDAHGTSVSVTCTASSVNGAIAAYWIADGALPWGLTLDPASGTISGTLANRPGIYTATLGARDVRGVCTTTTLSWIIS